jgi:hypothetical protein
MKKQTVFSIQVNLSKTYDIEVSREEIEQNLYELFESELLFKVDGLDFIKYDVIDKK